MTTIHDEHSCHAISNMCVEYSNYSDMRDTRTEYVMNIMHDEYP